MIYNSEMVSGLNIELSWILP